MLDVRQWRACIGLFNSRYGHCSHFNRRAGSTSPLQCVLCVVLAFLSELSSALMSTIRSKNTAPTTLADLTGKEKQTLIVCVTTNALSLSVVIGRCYLLSFYFVFGTNKGFFLLPLLLLLSGDVETNPGPPKAGTLPLKIFRHYFYRMAKAFGETTEELATQFLAADLIGRETYEKVRLPTHTNLEKANLLLLAVDSVIDADRDDKTLRKLCKLMSKHRHLKKLSIKIQDKYDAVFDGKQSLASSSESDSSEDESDLRTAVKRTTQSRINNLPHNVAADIKWCSWRASWHCSNTRKGYHSDAEADKVAFNDHGDTFKKNAAGILSAETCDNIKWMFWNMAWHTANTRWKYMGDAAKDKEGAEKHYKYIVDSKEMSEELASNIKEMGWSAAWHCANTRVGYTTDATFDKKNFESYSRKITGEV